MTSRTPRPSRSLAREICAPSICSRPLPPTGMATAWRSSMRRSRKTRSKTSRFAWPRPAKPSRQSARPDQHHAGDSHKPPPLEGTAECQIPRLLEPDATDEREMDFECHAIVIDSEVHARMERDRSVRPGNQFGDGLDVDRLGDVVIHAGLLRSSPILFLSVARKGDDEDVMKTFLTQGSGNLITVHDGQAYVQQEDARSISPGGLDSLAAVEDNLNLMAEQTQQPGQAGCKVLVVVHDQDPTLLRRLGLIHRGTRRYGNHGILLGVSGRKPRREGASFTVPITP